MPDEPHQPGRLKRELGVFHAVLLGLGSILGTGVFVSIGIAAGIAGPAVLIAIVLAAMLALCNGLSSAQLAAAHPVAGGTYEYGYKYLHPKLGFTAGWMFLLAKSASAATAALGASDYLLSEFVNEDFFLLGLFYEQGLNINILIHATALPLIALVTLLVLFGIRRSAWANLVLVAITVAGLIVFITYVFFGLDHADGYFPTARREFWVGSNGYSGLFFATALMFVAYTGYGRIATLGEEVHEPRRTIPRAIIATLAVSAVLYVGVGAAIVSAHKPDWKFLESVQILPHLIWGKGPDWLSGFIAFAAITAMLGVLLNLVLGLSRVLLAMGRRRDVPGVFEKVNTSGTTPVPAVIGVGVLIAGLTLIGDVKTTWSFSAFTVLIYYGITNLAALKLPKENRLYPRAYAWAGLGGCFFLCWWVEPIVWGVGLGLIALGLVWHTLAPMMFGPPPRPTEICVSCGYDLRASKGSCPECGAAIVQEEC